jgi:hypothetical protein
LELAFEHDRWFDIIRTGQAQSAMAANGKTFVVGKHEVYPILSLLLMNQKDCHNKILIINL